MGFVMTILGIDPGYAIVGFGLIKSERGAQSMITCGAITTAAGLAMATRLLQIERDLSELLGKTKPEAVAVEELFFNTNIKTGINVAQARGVILAVCAGAGIDIFEYTPLQVKQAVTGYGKADKNQVMEMTKRLLKLESTPKPDDAADALAIALCHARSSTSLLSELNKR